MAKVGKRKKTEGKPLSMNEIRALIDGEKDLSTSSKTPETESTVSQSDAIVLEKTQSNENLAELEKFFEQVNAQTYKIVGGLYVDEDIKRFLSVLREKGGVKIGNLVSHILEEWIEENSDLIAEIMSKNRKNRFLDRFV
jgi:hypothetical protein